MFFSQPKSSNFFSASPPSSIGEWEGGSDRQLCATWLPAVVKPWHLYINKWQNNPKFFFPGRKSLCSSARSEVANQVITRTCIRLIEDHGIGLTLQQFYYWNCRAECSPEGWDHPGLAFCLSIHSEMAEHCQEQRKLQMDVPEYHHSQEMVST